MNEPMNYSKFLQNIKTGATPGNENCPVASVLFMLQGKWKNHILFELCKNDVLRFGEFKKALPDISNTMLTSTLRELEADGLVSRIQYNEIPPHVEYSVTEKGKDLMPIFNEMYIWGIKYNFGHSDR